MSEVINLNSEKLEHMRFHIRLAYEIETEIQADNEEEAFKLANEIFEEGGSRILLNWECGKIFDDGEDMESGDQH